MFKRLRPIADVPKDAYRALFDADARPHKVYLAGGTFKNERGESPILESVRRAEELVLREESTKDYLRIEGDRQFLDAVRDLIFGTIDRPMGLLQTPGGTSALRLAGEVLHTDVWISDPTWGNHHHIFRAAGVATRAYPYPVIDHTTLDFPRLLAHLGEIPAGGIVLLHGTPHNPTGIDPSPDQWREIAALLKNRGVLPIVDVAFFGFADGIEEDLTGVRLLAEALPETIVAISLSKAFSIYRERVGALIVVGKSPDDAERFVLHAKHSARANYSSPPFHGAAVIARILRDAELRTLWEGENRAMRDRIRRMRQRFADVLGRDFAFATTQRGLFLPTGLSSEDVATLRDRHALYIGPGGYVNVTACTEETIAVLAEYTRGRTA